MAKINPFTPNRPINPAMFVGRTAETRKLDSYLTQTKMGRPVNFIITGERGIGKTSLMIYFQAVAEGVVTSFENEEFNFLVITTDINSSTTEIGLVKKIEMGLTHKLGKTEKTREYLSTLWGFLQRIEIGSLGFKKADGYQEEELILERFSYSLADLAERVCRNEEESTLFNANYDGILILIDEADNASKELGLGTFIKLLLERLQIKGCNRISIGLVGLPNIRDVLRMSHKSSLRLFEELELERLEKPELDRVIAIGLDKAEEINNERTKITVEAIENLFNLSEGFPHFIQQFGYSAFEADTDNIITIEDVMDGAYGDYGAINLIGNRYYRDDYYKRIKSDTARKILKFMAALPQEWTSRQSILKEFNGNSTGIDNALRTLRKNQIIVTQEGKQGYYRLRQVGFALWMALYTSGKKGIERQLGFKS